MTYGLLGDKNWTQKSKKMPVIGIFKKHKGNIRKCLQLYLLGGYGDYIFFLTNIYIFHIF